MRFTIGSDDKIGEVRGAGESRTADSRMPTGLTFNARSVGLTKPKLDLRMVLSVAFLGLVRATRSPHMHAVLGFLVRTAAVAIEPAVGRSNGIGISRRPPHPNAALLFYEYMIAAAQPLMVKMNYLPASIKAASPLKGIRIKNLAAAPLLDGQQKSNSLFDEIVVARRPCK